MIEAFICAFIIVIVALFAGDETGHHGVCDGLVGIVIGTWILLELVTLLGGSLWQPLWDAAKILMGASFLILVGMFLGRTKSSS